MSRIRTLGTRTRTEVIEPSGPYSVLPTISEAVPAPALMQGPGIRLGQSKTPCKNYTAKMPCNANAPRCNWNNDTRKCNAMFGMTQEEKQQLATKMATAIRKETKGKTIIEQKKKVNAMLKNLAEKKFAEKMQKDLEETGKLSSSNSAKMEKAVEKEKKIKKTPVEQVDPKDARTYTQLLSQVASSAGGALASAGSGAFQLLKKHGPGVASAVGTGLKDAAVGIVAVLGAISEAVRESADEMPSVRESSKVPRLKQRTAPASEDPGAESPPSSRSSSRKSSSNKSYRNASPDAYAVAAAPSPEAHFDAVAAAQPRIRQREHADSAMLRQGMAMGFETGPGHVGRLRGQKYKPNAKGGKSRKTKKTKKNKRGTMKHYFY